jgi:ParB family chromosome partitioning protein
MMADLRDLPHASVYPNPDQPRKHFDPEKLRELAESIRESGLMQPIVVRPDGRGMFMIVAGERRWRAHGLLELPTIRALVVDLTDDALADQAIIENLQRLDITPLEEAHAFQRRLDSNVSIDDLAKRVGVEARRIRSRVELLKLRPEYQDALAKGILEMGAANHLARLDANHQPLLFAAIRAGKCQTRAALRATADTILAAQCRNTGQPVPLTLTAAAALVHEQGSLFADTGPSAAQRESFTAFERKLQAVTDMINDAFDENEVVIVQKIGRSHASVMEQRLELLERQIRQMRLALVKANAAASAAA